MNLIAAVVGWCVIAAALAIPIGKFLNRRMSRRDDDLPPLPRRIDTSHTQWPEAKDRRERDTDAGPAS